MEGIKIHVFTNLDDHDCSMWNKQKLTLKPQLGDWMAVRYKGSLRDLKIVSICYRIADNEPYLRIELHSIR